MDRLFELAEQIKKMTHEERCAHGNYDLREEFRTEHAS